jgi:hypothetical protein
MIVRTQDCTQPWPHAHRLSHHPAARSGFGAISTRGQGAARASRGRPRARLGYCWRPPRSICASSSSLPHRRSHTSPCCWPRRPSTRGVAEPSFCCTLPPHRRLCARLHCRTKIAQGWPKLWANFTALIGIFSQSNGPRLAIWANPVQFYLQQPGCRELDHP